MTSFETATARLVQQELGACALIQDLLPLYMDHEVSASSRDLIAEHLARCERCAGYMAGARSMRDQLRREGVLRAGQAAQDQATRQAIVIGQRRLRWLVLGGLCMLFGLGLMMAMVLGIVGSASVKTIPGVEAAPVDPALHGQPPLAPPDVPQPWPAPTLVPAP
jgi:predicted anti-sigma-YlaC factor YlaD